MTDFNAGGPGATPGAGPSGPRADFGIRLVAYIIDVVMVWVVILVLTVALRGLGYLLGFVLSLGYFIYFEGSPSGQTVGKKVMNIRIVDADNGGPIGYGRAFVRYIGKIISAIPCALGYFWMLWDANKQTWHDKMASSVVVPTSAYPVAAWPG